MIELEILKSLGYTTVSDAFYQHIAMWQSWYKGRVESFHSYKWYNGQDFVPMEKLQAGMAKKCCEDWADLTLNEKVSITLEGTAEQAWWDSVSSASKWRRRANRQQELAFALGTTAIVARVVGLAVSDAGVAVSPAAGVRLDFVRADKIFPLTWEDGDISECAFSKNITADGKEFVYLQLHVLNSDGHYDILNRFFDVSRGSAKEVDPSHVKGFETVPPVFHTAGSQRLFVINSPNIVNNVDLDCPLGISVYANAIHNLQNVDNVFSGFDSELTLGRKRVAVQPEALKSVDGRPVFDPNDVAFYMLPVSRGENPSTLIQELGGDLRIEEYERAMQLALNKLSLKVGLGASHWKFSASGGITTATEVISANSDEFRTLKKHEIVLNDVITELVRIVLMLGNRFCGQTLNEEIPMSVDFDDSIIEDTSVDFERDCRMLANGTLSRVEFRMRWLNEDEKTARKNLPTINALLDDDTPPEE